MRPLNVKERGIALLSVMAMMAAMAVAAVIALDAIARAVALSKTGSGRGQVAWYVASVEQIALATLDDLVAQSQGELSVSAGSAPRSITLNLPTGRMDALLTDASNCFNLNGIAAKNEGRGYDIDTEKATRLRDLLNAVDLPSGAPVALTDTLADWIDVDSMPRPLGYEDGYYVGQKTPHRTAGTLISSVTELRAIAGFSPEVVNAITPYVCVRPDTVESVLNINLLSPEGAPLLAAVYSPALDIDTARALLEHRPENGWADIEAFQAEEEIARIRPDERRDQAISVASSHFSLAGVITVDRHRFSFEVLLAVAPNGRSAVVSRRVGEI